MFETNDETTADNATAIPYTRYPHALGLLSLTRSRHDDLDPVHN
jgi:hypothetical protein